MTPLAHFSRPVARTIACTAAMALLLVQFGCATRPPSPDLHYQLRNEVTALIPARLETELSLKPFAVGRPSGALEGAGQGFVSCLQGFGSGSCSGEVCGAVLLLILGIAVTCSAVGAVVGAIQATPADEAGAMTGSMAQVTQQLASHLTLTRQVLSRAGNVEGLTVELVDEESLAWTDEPQRWQILRARGFVNALEIGVTEIEFAGGSGGDPELVLHMIARARLIELESGTEKYREDFTFSTPPRHFSKWAANQGEVMRAAVREGLETLSVNIASRLFEQVALPMPSGDAALPWSDEFGCCWLCPQAPAHKISHAFWEGPAKVKYSLVSTRQPQLAWEAFPREGQKAGLYEMTGGTLPPVRYDLRIWEVRGTRPGALVYERRGLAVPSHRVETPLMPGYRYYWSFRACFDAGRGEVCTPWACSSVPATSCELPTIPDENYYRFQVP